MAAIYSGIHLKLKSPQTPWEDKLKLARFAWISSQCLLPNKEQVLLDWSTHALTGFYSKKVVFSQSVLEGLWCYLDDLLHSKKLRTLLNQGKTISLRLNIAQVLLDRLQECVSDGDGPSVCVSTLLNVCQGIISSPGLSSIFTTKYELMTDLLAKLCFLACHRLQHQPSPKGILYSHSKPEPITELLSSQEVPVTESLQIQPFNDPSFAQCEPVTETPQDQPMTESNKSQPLKDHQSSHMFEVLLQVLSCYLSVQRQQGNPNRIFTMVTNQLIQPIILLRHLLASGEHTNQHLRSQLSKDLRIKMDSILQLALFPPEHLSSFKEELLSKDDCGKRGPGGPKGPLRPVSTMVGKLTSQEYCDSSLHYAVKSNTLSLLFKFCIESYGKGAGEAGEEQKMLCFHFLTRLVPVLDIDLDSSFSSVSISLPNATQPSPLSPGKDCPSVSLSFSPGSWSLTLLSLETLLSQVLSADIYNVAADRIRHGEVQFNFYRKLVEMLFNHAQQSTPAWYRCLKVLLDLNHLIIEPDLDQLISSSWVDSECMESRVQRARQMLVSSLLHTYTKLRQLPYFFSELLSIVCQPAMDDHRPPLLPEEVCLSLKTCLLDTTPSQGLEICSLVLASIRRYILPDLEKEGREEEMDESDGENIKGKLDQTREKGELERQKGDASLKLLSLSQLLHAVLFNLKTMDNASPLPLVRQTQSMMEEMGNVVKTLQQLVSSENITDVGQGMDHIDAKTTSNSQPGSWALWKQKTQEAGFLLRYTWVEMDMLLHIHCSKYISQESTQDRTSSQPQDQAPGATLVLTHIEALLSGEMWPVSVQSSPVKPSYSPMSCLLRKLLTLQQLKKALLNNTVLALPNTTEVLRTVAQFILSREELSVSLDGEQMWDGQIGSVNAISYHVAHWYLITSNLPLIAPYLSEEDLGHFADVLLSSQLSKQMGGNTVQLPGYLSTSLISSQLLQSPILIELPSVYSATVKSLMQRIFGVLVASEVPQDCPTLLKFQEMVVPEKGHSVDQSNTDASHPFPKVRMMEAIVEEMLRSSQTGKVSVFLTDKQTQELSNLVHIATNLNPDGMSAEDLSSLFLLLLFILTSTSGLPERVNESPSKLVDDALFLGKLLQLLASITEGRDFNSVLKLIHGSSLLQAVVSSLLFHCNKGRFCFTGSPDWLNFVRATQGFIRSLMQLIIQRNSSVRLNLEQFTSYITSDEITGRHLAVMTQTAPDPGNGAILGRPPAVLSLHLLLASLTSFCQVMTSNLGRSTWDQTLAQMLARITAALGPTIKNILKPETVSILGQGFLVEVVTVVLQCELSTLPMDNDKEQTSIQPTLSHMSLYCSFCQQILKELSSDSRPVDFLVSSLHFLSTFYRAVEKMTGEREKKGEEKKREVEELDELYIQIMQNIYRLLASPWLSLSDIRELEPAVEELLRHLLEGSTTEQFSVFLLLIREGLDTGKLYPGNYKEALSAATVIKLLGCCSLPEPCSNALRLIAPQIISAMVFLVKVSSQDTDLTPSLTIPMVTSMTSLLRYGEGQISNPHHVTQVLGALQLVPLDHLTSTVYQSAFLAVHEALFVIIQCHPKVILNAAPSFLNVFYRLVASIMQEGRQRGYSDTGPNSDVYLKCSRLVERMYSHIAAAAENFKTLPAFMVAQYVTELQKVTLRPEVKHHLSEGIYRILDLCMEQDIKFLTAGLQMGVREVFNELYSSYSHYHKTQRQGEEKYTV